MISHYYCKSVEFGTYSRPFNQWHKRESENHNRQHGDPVAERDQPAPLTRAAALELINKWNRLAAVDGGKYYILGGAS